MKKTPFCIVLAAFILIISASHAFASNGVTWIDPTYNPTGLLAGFYGYSQDEYMNHVTEYDILTGTAQAHSITGNPQQEEEIIPFMKIIENYLLMSRLLDGARHDDPRYRIAWNQDGGHRRMAKDNLI